MVERKIGFFAQAYKDDALGIGVSIMYQMFSKDFCVWIHIGIHTLLVGFNFSKKGETE